MLVTTLGYDEYKGVIAIGRIFAGTMRIDQPVVRLDVAGGQTSSRVRYLYVHQGLQRLPVEVAEAGEIVAVAGIEDVGIGETIADPDQPVALPIIRIEEPTVRMTFGVSTSPFAGREGTWGTSRKLRERLFNELLHNVALRVEETDSTDTFLVSGRGELQLAILIETMRREGYEFQVSRPEVIYKDGEGGEVLEPFEEVHIEVPEAHVGTAVDLLGQRRGQMIDMEHGGADGTAHLTYIVPTRGLLGFRYQFLTSTKGMGIVHSIFHAYLPSAGRIDDRPVGSLVAWEAGTATAYGLKAAEDRGRLFIEPGIEVYEGMVVGQHQRPGDLAINIAKKKHLTNVRSSTQDIEVRLAAPRRMSLDECLEYLGEDELLEVTPLAFRIRKRLLATEERGKAVKRAKEGLATGA